MRRCNYYERNLRRNVRIPLLAVTSETVLPLPSSHLPAELSTLNLYSVDCHDPNHALPKVVVNDALQSYDGQFGCIWMMNNNNNSNNNNNNNQITVGTIGCAVQVLATNQVQQTLSSLSSSSSSQPSSLIPSEELLGDESDNDDDVLTAYKILEIYNKGRTGATNEINKEPNKVPTTPPPTLPPPSALCRGTFRFIVKEVVSTIPYPVVIVDELVDTDIETDDTTNNNNDQPELTNDFTNDYDNNSEEEDDFDEEDDDDDDIYAHIPAEQLSSRTLSAMEAHIKLRSETSQKTPLELMILEHAGLSSSSSSTEHHLATLEEETAVFSVFRGELVEMNSPSLRRFAIAFLAGEIAGLDNAQRHALLRETNSFRRLRHVLAALESQNDLRRAQKMAEQLTSSSTSTTASSNSNSNNSSNNSRTANPNTHNDPKQLQVGAPEMPPWARSLRDGLRMEYFWNEEYGWCAGTVVGEPFKIVDEIIITFRFDDPEDEGQLHRLPLTADEKVRWRPLSS